MTIALTNLGAPAGTLKVTVTYTPTHLEALYAIGGSIEQWENAGGMVEKFDPLENRWSPGTALPSFRSDAVAVNLQNKLYLIGGSGAIITFVSFPPSLSPPPPVIDILLLHFCSACSK